MNDPYSLVTLAAHILHTNLVVRNLRLITLINIEGVVLSSSIHNMLLYFSLSRDYSCLQLFTVMQNY